MKSFKKFIKSRRGAVFMLVGLTFFSMVGVTATSIDFARGSLLKSELVSSLDAAALAGGTIANSGNMNAMVSKYYNVNLPANYLGATISQPTIAMSADKTTLTISASASLKNSMMQIFNWKTANVNASTEVTIERKGLEVVLVMDNTGSMYGQPMTTMKTAAADLVNILYGNKETIDDLYVGLVPYVSMVNIGKHRTGWLTGYNASSFSPTTWKGCVASRGNNEVTDDTPTVGGKWAPHMWENSTDNRWTCPSNNNSCLNELYSTNTHYLCGDSANIWRTTSGNPRYNINANSCASIKGSGPNWGCGPAITPLVKEKTIVLDAIDEMESWSRGGTMSDIGMAWGWRVISPKWRGLWGSPSLPTLPLNYNTPMMEKVVILLTDGENQFSVNDRSGWGRLSEGRLGTTNYYTATTRLNQKLQTVCTSMKQAGIIIYTITFTNGVNENIRSIYRGCSTSTQHYFDAPTSEELQTTFKTIGDSLSNLRISK